MKKTLNMQENCWQQTVECEMLYHGCHTLEKSECLILARI